MNKLCAQLVKEYLKSVRNLFNVRIFVPPIKFEIKKDVAALFYENVKIWENEPNHRTHLMPGFLAELRH